MEKSQLVLIILISASLLTGFKPVQTSETISKTETKMNRMEDGEQIFLDHVEECISIIEKEAQKIPMQGVVMVAYIPGEKTKSWTSKMKVVGKITKGKNNLLAIAYAKASEMAITLKDSGEESRKNMIGELGYRGGVIMKVDSGYLVAAFSGGTSQDDADVSKIGLEWLAKKF